jgi:hypothetical protein
MSLADNNIKLFELHAPNDEGIHGASSKSSSVVIFELSLAPTVQ